jgi:hypothetical protein
MRRDTGGRRSDGDDDLAGDGRELGTATRRLWAAARRVRAVGWCRWLGAGGLGPTVGGGSGLRAATADGVGEQRRLAVALEENETARAGARPYNGNLRQPA